MGVRRGAACVAAASLLLAACASETDGRLASTPTLSAPTPTRNAGQADSTLAAMQAWAGRPWVTERDPATDVSFQLPERVPATRRGIGRLYLYGSNGDGGTGLGVSFASVGSAAGARASVTAYAGSFARQFGAFAKVVILDRHDVASKAGPTSSFRIRFVSTGADKKISVWLVKAIAVGADLVMAQTISFAPSTDAEPAYLAAARRLQARLTASLRQG